MLCHIFFIDNLLTRKSSISHKTKRKKSFFWYEAISRLEHRAGRDIIDQPSRLRVAGLHNYVNVMYGKFELFYF
jgi:hypothetical protein